jgi:hypothetical protein
VQEILRDNGRERGIGIGMGEQDAGRINPALHREGKFAIPGDHGLAGTTIIMGNLIRCQAPGACGRACRAGTGKKDHPALVALPLSPADAFERYPGVPYGLEYGRIRWYRDNHVHGTEKYAGGISHAMLRKKGLDDRSGDRASG